MKKTITLILCVVLIMTLFAGCSKKEAGIIGTWQAEVNSDIMYEFDTDGKVYFSEDGGEHAILGQYTFDGKYIDMKFVSFSGNQTIIFKVESLSKNMLVVSQGVTRSLKKVNYSIK